MSEHLAQLSRNYWIARLAYETLLKKELRGMKRDKHLPKESHLEMLELRKKGKTYRAIGVKFGITTQRVEQIIKKYL